MRISIPEVLLRILAIVFPLSGLILAITIKESTFVGVVTYKYSSVFRYLVGVDAVTSALSAIGLSFVYFLGCSRNSFNLFLFDLITTILIISGCSAATTIGFVSKHGDMMGLYAPVCPFVGSFCKKISISVVLSYAAFFIILSLTIISARYLTTKHPQ